MIRTLIFDFGNVIGYFDHMKTIKRLAPYTPLSPSELFDACYHGELEDRYEEGKISSSDFAAAALAIGRLSCTAEEFFAAFVDIFTVNHELCEFIPRLKPKYRLILASNTNEAHANFYEKMFAETLRHFDYLGMSHRLNARKPNAEFFTALQPHVATNPQECVFIDDMPANVAAGRRHGWHAIQYVGMKELRRDLRNFGVDVPE